MKHPYTSRRKGRQNSIMRFGEGFLGFDAVMGFVFQGLPAENCSPALHIYAAGVLSAFVA